MAVVTMREALNQALSEEMERDERVILMGEEVAEYQGAYKVSSGLLQKFGPKRVLDTPISESGFAGLGVGAAMQGLRPVVEFMTWSFSMVAYDQIVNAGLQVGATHSHTPENWYANVPALTVITPAFPDDAKGLLKSAIRSNNPVCFIENEKLYGFKDEVPEGELLTTIGKARIRREGSQVTLIANSASTHVALASALQLEADGVSAEVIDLRTIKPLDIPTILGSVAKTNRVVIVEENKPFAGWGAQVAFEIQNRSFDDLDAPIERVTGLDVPQPYARVLEQAVMPSAERVTEAAKKTLA
ncbi:alpha-ketoacid dehydrogenase subunit beta [bacterium]|nr:alpha-ketoacid dehydrogenase subunit beta [bacterium]